MQSVQALAGLNRKARSALWPFVVQGFARALPGQLSFAGLDALVDSCGPFGRHRRSRQAVTSQIVLSRGGVENGEGWPLAVACVPGEQAASQIVLSRKELIDAKRPGSSGA